MASLYRQKRSKNWYAKIYESGNPKPKRFSLGTNDKDEALEKLEKIKAKRLLGEPIEPRIDKLRFWELCDLVVNNYKARNLRSLKSLKMRLRMHIVPKLGLLQVKSMRTADIEEYIGKRLDEAASDGTINRELAVIKRAFRLGGRDYAIRAPHIPMRRENNIRRGFFERDQLEALCRHLPSYLVAPVQFAYATGWRVSEIRSLQWRHIDFAAGEIRLDPGTTKNDDGRVFPMFPELRSLLEELKPASALHVASGSETKTSHFVFTYRRSKNGPLLPIGDFRKSWARACYDAGLSCVVHWKRDERGEIVRYKEGREKGKPMIAKIDAEAIFHDFRRTAVRNLARNGIHERVAMKMTGHRTRDVFDRYNIVSETDLRDAAKRLDQAGILSGIVPKKSKIANS